MWTAIKLLLTNVYCALLVLITYPMVKIDETQDRVVESEKSITGYIRPFTMTWSALIVVLEFVLSYRLLFPVKALPFQVLQDGSSFFLQPSQPIQAADWTIFALGFFGIAIRQWAISTLGRLFTYQASIRKEHKLIIAGPFK